MCIFFKIIWEIKRNHVILQNDKRLRGGAGVAHWAHNPKVVGSNPAPATRI